MRIVIRSHYRKKKNGVSVVRRHFRASKKVVAQFRKKHGIDSPVELKKIRNSKGTSMAHTDSVLDSKTKIPQKHIIRLEERKIKEEGENPGKILQHELAHVLDKEHKDKLSREFHKTAKNTQAYKVLKSSGNKYEAHPQEIFARAFAQATHGVTNPDDVHNGLEWHRSDFRKVKKRLAKVVRKR